MRIFAKEYPEFKNKSKEIYNYLRLLKEENNGFRYVFVWRKI